MSKIYLFDWGDTLMVDFPEQSGKMCDWPVVQAIDGAAKVLETLAETSSVYVATNAADSSVADIQSAFARVGLARYISGYFCKANLGIGKGTPAFFHQIIERLGVSHQSVVMVGDNYDTDIAPALSAGINALWLTKATPPNDVSSKVKPIRHLTDILCS